MTRVFHIIPHVVSLRPMVIPYHSQKYINTVGYTNIGIGFYIQRSVDMSHTHCHAYYRVSTTAPWIELNTNVVEDDDKAKRHWGFSFGLMNSTLSNNLDLAIQLESIGSGSSYCYWSVIQVYADPLPSQTVIQTAFNQLTLSPSQYDDAKANSVGTEGANALLNILWFALGYLLIGL
eukprot:302304_1